MADTTDLLKRLEEIAWMHRDGYMCASSCDTCWLLKLTRALLESQGELIGRFCSEHEVAEMVFGGLLGPAYAHSGDRSRCKTCQMLARAERVQKGEVWVGMSDDLRIVGGEVMPADPLRELAALLAESEPEPSFSDVTATRCLRHATIPPTILPPASQECGLCMREEGVLVGRSEQRPEIAWLIESRLTPSPTWWTGSDWARDSLKAVRFCRKQDAEAALATLPDKHVCFTSEHQWGFGAESEPEPAPLKLGHEFVPCDHADACLHGYVDDTELGCGQPPEAH